MGTNNKKYLKNQQKCVLVFIEIKIVSEAVHIDISHSYFIIISSGQIFNIPNKYIFIS